MTLSINIEFITLTHQNKKLFPYLVTMKDKKFDLNENQVIDILKLRQVIRHEDVNVSECFNPDYVHLSKNPREISKLKASIGQTGLLQPIVLAKTQFTETNKLFNWEIISGTKRHFVCKELNLKSIFSMKIDKIFSKEDIEKLKLYESYLNYKIPASLITPKVVWLSTGVQEVYISQRSENFNKDVKVCSEITGIPRVLVSQAIKYAIDSKMIGQYKNSSPIEKI